jgi:serine protease Do
MMQFNSLANRRVSKQSMVKQSLAKRFSAIALASVMVLAGTTPLTPMRLWANDIPLKDDSQPSLTGASKPEFELDPRIQAAEQQRIEAVQRALPATVSIFIPGGGGGGSGVLISPDGYALTNFHVTSPAGTYMRCGLSDGRIYDAVIIGIDPVGDLALIRLLGRDDFPYAEMADSRRARVGQWCMVIGNPFLLATNLQPSVSWGILSGVGRYQYPAGTLLEYADCLQTDASINPGNSGGPLFDDAGRLLGIVGRASFEKRGRVNVGVGYAISINQAQNFLGDLHSGRILDHATLGATVATDSDGGARVSNILQSSDAYRRGLRYGHTILEIDGRSVNTANEVQNVLATLPPQWRVKLDYLDRGVRKSTLVRLANLHGFDELLTKMAAALPPPPPVPDAPPQPEDQQPPKLDEPPAEQDPAGDAGDQDGRPRQSDAEKLKKLIPGAKRPPRPARGDGTNESLPPAVAKLFEARHGFANYHPNRVKQQELVESFRSQFPGSAAATDDADEAARGQANSVWRIEGVTDDDAAAPVKLLINDGNYSLIIGERTVQATQRSELYNGILAGNVSGILACMDSWRALLSQGAQRYGDSYYRGRVPLLGERPLRDCLIGVAGELETAWISHPDSGMLEAIEVTADRDDDPAELLISWSEDRSNPPTHLELRYGTQSLLKMRVDSWRLGTEGDALE